MFVLLSFGLPVEHVFECTLSSPLFMQDDIFSCNNSLESYFGIVAFVDPEVAEDHDSQPDYLLLDLMFNCEPAASCLFNRGCFD